MRMFCLGNMEKITSFRQLLVWQKSMDLAVRCYETACRLPRSEQPVLGYQIANPLCRFPQT
jgi:hypothetical protein